MADYPTVISTTPAIPVFAEPVPVPAFGVPALAAPAADEPALTGPEPNPVYASLIRPFSDLPPPPQGGVWVVPRP